MNAMHTTRACDIHYLFSSEISEPEIVMIYYRYGYSSHKNGYLNIPPISFTELIIHLYNSVCAYTARP